MGQAKQRGSFEDRKADAIKRTMKEELERDRELRRIEAAKTPEQRDSERLQRARFRAILALGFMGR